MIKNVLEAALIERMQFSNLHVFHDFLSKHKEPYHVFVEDINSDGVFTVVFISGYSSFNLFDIDLDSFLKNLNKRGKMKDED